MENKTKWTTRNGDTIDIKDMTDNHLDNAINFLKRKIKEYPGYQVYIGNSEYAEQAAEHENLMNEQPLFECQVALEELEKEKKRRRQNDKS